MGITLIAMCAAFGIFFAYYPWLEEFTQTERRCVMAALWVCLFFTFFGPFITGEF